MGKDVIVACDFATRKEVFDFLDRFTDRKPFVKIGMELFYAEGPQIVRDIKARGHKIFLDLKLHDIPNTVKKAMKVLSALDVDMCNVHAAGTGRMMTAAVEGLTRADGTRPLLIAVTQLTSTDDVYSRYNPVRHLFFLQNLLYCRRRYVNRVYRLGKLSGGHSDG